MEQTNDLFAKQIKEEYEEKLLTTYELNEGLLITNLSELEEGEECYIKIHHQFNYSHYNGIYKFYDLIHNSGIFINLDDNRPVSQITIDDRLITRDRLPWFMLVNINSWCKIYKPTRTEYVLK